MITLDNYIPTVLGKYAQNFSTHGNYMSGLYRKSYRSLKKKHFETTKKNFYGIFLREIWVLEELPHTNTWLQNQS